MTSAESYRAELSVIKQRIVNLRQHVLFEIISEKTTQPYWLGADAGLQRMLNVLSDLLVYTTQEKTDAD